MAATELYKSVLLQNAGLKGYWRLEDVNDSSASGYNLTNNNTVTFTTGVFGNAGTFNGSNQCLSIANASCANLEIAGVQSWGAWVKPTDFANYNGILGKSSGGATKDLYIDQTNGKAVFRLYNLTTTASIVSDVAVTQGAWNFVVGVYDGSAIRIYVNGVVKSAAASGNATATSAQFSIGSTTGSGNYFKGQIDDAFVLNIALSADQIKELYEGRMVGEGYPQ